MTSAKHAAFALTLVLYVLTFGQNWTWYAAALMLAAYVRYRGDLLGPL